MKYMITAALALCLIGGAAGAQDRDRDKEHDRGRSEGRQDGPRGPAPGRTPQGPPPGLADRGRSDRAGPDRRFDRPEASRGPDRFRGPEPGFRPGVFLSEHNWRGGRFRAPFYRYPPGWGYRTWAFGAFLPSVFLAPTFTIGQYWVYGLPAPPPGYHWIRVGPDALLVRYGDGYVLDAAYGIFF